MRIAHLSDIHLSSHNIEQLENYYLKALIDDLVTFYEEKPIDILLISGDLVDKGGESFGEKNGYDEFERLFLMPLMEALKLTREQVLFVPGNHDVDRSLIEEDSEYSLTERLNSAMANKIVKDTYQEFSPRNQRMKPFKTFERKFHEENSKYFVSNYESIYIYEKESERIGFLLVNDSWRCSSKLVPEKHFWGANQLFRGLKAFGEAGTILNIAVFHHPFRLINNQEEDEVNNILESRNVQLAVFGHTHHLTTSSTVTTAGSLVKLVCRSAFNDPDEKVETYQPGYAIIDIDSRKRSYVVNARKFIRNSGFRFDKDTDSLPEGTAAGVFPKNMNFPLTEETLSTDNSLPSAYSANVEKVVQLLIGDSLYGNAYSFVRELVQNAVDACTRVKEVYPDRKPKIHINISQAENYFEVVDEGDGMSSRVLRDNFAVIGKSISQEMARTGSAKTLISKFGIGFISTFIAAAKVYVTTKSEWEDRVGFWINDVFKAFDYAEAPPEGLIESEGTGTTVRVYLKQQYPSQKLVEQVFLFCRHIDNLIVIQDGKPILGQQSWNVEKAVYKYEEENAAYQLKLGIALAFLPIFASNTGFLITQNPTPIVPYRFPPIIFGEANLCPGTVDLDLSRTTIMQSAKAQEIRKKISLALKVLFAKGLTNPIPNLSPSILPYLQFYLSTIDQEKAQYDRSYVDFYTKEELVGLCAKYTMVQFAGRNVSVDEALKRAKTAGHSSFYVYNPNSQTEHEIPFAQYLSFSGRPVGSAHSVPLSFRDGQMVVSLLAVYEKICQYYGFTVVKIWEDNDLLKTLTISPDAVPRPVMDQLLDIQKQHGIEIKPARLANVDRAVIRVKDIFVLNLEHGGLAKLTQKAEDLPAVVIKTYLQGILRLTSKDW